MATPHPAPQRPVPASLMAPPSPPPTDAPEIRPAAPSSSGARNQSRALLKNSPPPHRPTVPLFPVRATNQRSTPRLLDELGGSGVTITRGGA